MPWTAMSQLHRNGEGARRNTRLYTVPAGSQMFFKHFLPCIIIKEGKNSPLNVSHKNKCLHLHFFSLQKLSIQFIQKQGQMIFSDSHFFWSVVIIILHIFVLRYKWFYSSAELVVSKCFFSQLHTLNEYPSKTRGYLTVLSKRKLLSEQALEARYSINWNRDCVLVCEIRFSNRVQ